MLNFMEWNKSLADGCQSALDPLISPLSFFFFFFCICHACPPPRKLYVGVGCQYKTVSKGVFVLCGCSQAGYQRA